MADYMFANICGSSTRVILELKYNRFILFMSNLVAATGFEPVTSGL